VYDFKKTGFLYISGQIGSFLAFLLSSVNRKTIIFYETDDEALLLKEEIEFFRKGEAHIFPMYANRVFEKEDEALRTGFLHHLVADDNFMGLFPYGAVSHPLMGVAALSARTRTILFGDTVFQEDLTGFLEETGYELASLVREPGQYAKRGGIIDMFSPSQDRPVRIEFLGDEIYSIRSFDPLTQRSNREVEKCTITPVTTETDSRATILDYMGGNPILVHKGLPYLAQGLDDSPASQRLRESLRNKVDESLNIDVSGIRGDETGDALDALSNDDLRHLFEIKKTEIFKTLSEKLSEEWNRCPYVYISTSSRHQAERLQEIFKSYGIALPILAGIALPAKEKERGIVIGPLRRGFRTDNVILLAEEDIVGPKKRVIKKKWEGFDEFLNSFKDLHVGEWVVHIEHGIGVFQGIGDLKIDGYTKDFLIIEYQDGDKLYVPIDDLHLVQKFIGGEKAKPKVDKLGTSYWRNTKSRVRKHVEDIAKELITIYAEREVSEGHRYSPEDELFREMESRFEYEETEGQIQAINSVLDDLISGRPMDRVVCGDVGFGKTEVALRAAFKVMMDGKQVVMLVPTTILAEQHYNTFLDRLADYPIRVEMLSRFRTTKEQKAVVEDLQKGTVDIVIGTHRLLQKDLTLKDLGLLVIDEEHRFGVKHKEKLKLLKKNVDVLSLSATPIPRTLHMALTGIKDLSIINTPPLDRLAVKTYVVKFKDDLIRNGILKELDRGGQVFFVHNYIYNIGVVQDHLTKLLPGARIAVAHGKMEGRHLERTMLDFIERRYDILLSTNIIESGLDISNVNTIFVNNAHRMGLADLYQLRGRVGRSTRQAYAYLLVPKEEILTRDSLLRLKIIEEMTELGSGFQIANYDLEIRGAGNLLGREQSGNVNLIGFELYCNMLEEAVKELKEGGGMTKEEAAAEVNVPIDAFIPDSYVEDPAQKLLMYKRLSRIRDESEVSDMVDEIKDRYGEMPQPLANLINVIRLKCALTRAKIKRLEYTGRQIVLHVTEGTPLDMERVLKLAREGDGKVKLLPDGKIVMATEKKAEDLVGFARNVLMQIVSL
jgi:transcription-repair coupling factor (superfamily II helicase)